MKPARRSPVSFACFVAIGFLAPLPVHAAFTSCATDWNNFSGSNGFVAEYTYQGQLIRDHETSSDPTNGGTGVSPAEIDLASGSPGSFPGPYSTTSFGYYDGGTPWNPDDPATLEDDYIFFRWRLAATPVTVKNDFISRHYNVLFDVDGDGYKEYWVDVNGGYQSSGTVDQLQILYDNQNRQDVPSPAAARVSEFSASADPLATAACTAAGSPGRSHTRVRPAGDGTGDFFLDVQIPLTAFNDLAGNQVVFPDSPVAYAYSTSASNTDPLQKDFMNDLEFLSLADPIQFGDVVTPSGAPSVRFTDAAQGDVLYYVVGGEVFVYLSDPLANLDKASPECVTATVTNPATGDDERVTLCETGPSTGIFTNSGGLCSPAVTFPSPAPSPPTAWLERLRTSSATLDETWTLTYGGATGDWSVTGSVSGAQPGRAVHGTAYASATGGVAFTLYQSVPANGTTLSFCTLAADALVVSSAPGADDDGILQASPGQTIYVSYTNRNALTVTDSAFILGPCEAHVEFTRATGLPTQSFQIASSSAASDRLYVTVTHFEANADPGTVERLTVTLTGYDLQTLVLTETGPDTGVFRNGGGLATQVSDGVVTPEDGLWEDVDRGTVTASYSYSCGGGAYERHATSAVFTTSGGGRVAFTNGAGTFDVDLYAPGQAVFLKVTDGTYACAGPLTVTVTTASGDSETLRLNETAPGSGVYMNRRNDLVTTAGSAVVTSASSTFVAAGVQPGDILAVATGPDLGLYTIASVDSQTRLTLATPLGASRTGIAFTARPLMTAVFDGAATADDRVLEATHGDALTVAYTDCADGDPDPANDVKTDTATFNAPHLVLNRVLFAPDATTCQTEYFEVMNASASPVTATGYAVRDEDAELEYVIPSFQGLDLSLQPGEKILVSLGGYFTDFFDPVARTYYLFAPSAEYPSNVLGDSGDADPADQLVLLDGSGRAVDYVGWSATLSPSVDFYGDDSDAVLEAIWQDDAFREVASMAAGQSLARAADGVDTNAPADWTLRADATCQAIIDAYALTWATVRGLRADRSGLVELATGSQRGTASFRVWEAFGPAGEGRRPLHVDPVRARLADAAWPVLYRVETEPITGDYVLVEETERSGQRRWLGPFPVSDPVLERSLERVEQRLDAAGAPRGGARWAKGSRRPGKPGGTPRTAEAPRVAAAGGAGIKIRVRGAGIATVPLAQLGALGLPSRARLLLTRAGAEVPFWTTVDGEGAPALAFRAEELRTDYTDVSVYVLTWGRRRPALRVPLTVSGVPRAAGLVRVERGGLYLPRAPRELDPWLWDVLFSDGGPWPYDWWDPAGGDFDLVGLAPSAPGEAAVTVQLLGGSAHRHTVTAWVNGVRLGEVSFDGEVAARIEGTLPAAALRATGNRLSLEYGAETEGGEDFARVYLDHLEVAAAWTPPAGSAAVVGLDRWDPRLPAPATTRYLVVTHPLFLGAARRLAAHHESKGLRTAVVDVERAYDLYTAGIPDARAVEHLIRGYGRKGLRFVVLVGDDTFDPLDYTGAGAVSYLPSAVGWDPEFGRVPSENPYADLDDDGIPDVAIGRLPVQTAEQADALVAKILAARPRRGQRRNHLFVVDNGDPGEVQFRDKATAVAPTAAGASPAAWVDVADGVGAARSALRAGLLDGPAFTHYFGHGGPETWADEALLTVDDVPALAEMRRPTILLAWACQAQWYLNLWGPAVNEAMVLTPRGGAVASFGPAGITSPSAQRELYDRLYRVLSDRRLPLGEAIRRAKAELMREVPSARPVVEGFHLLGDPALALPR